MNEHQTDDYEPIILGKSIWMEDDAPVPDKENLRQAWKRLFDEELDTKKAITVEDHQDVILYLMPNGYLACVSYPGNSEIREVG